MTDENAVRAALSRLKDPMRQTDIVSAGRVVGVTVRDGRVGFAIEAPAAEVDLFRPVRDAAEAAAQALDGVEHVTAVLTAEVTTGAPAPIAGASRPAAPRPAPSSNMFAAPGIASMITVASAKGGVGKSTIAAHLACSLARHGHRVALLDADIYGPSAPLLFGLEDSRPQKGPDGRMIPPEAHGVAVMSIGFLVDTDAPIAWRGPKVMGALGQLLQGTDWGERDILVIDQPPGTGDVQLTLAQRAPLDGAVIVSTPHELALADMRRGVELFRRTRIPILGIVENMSAHTDPNTGAVFAPFGQGGAEAAAQALEAPFLGAIPLSPELSAARALTLSPSSSAVATFDQLSRAVFQAIKCGRRAPPNIEFVP